MTLLAAMGVSILAAADASSTLGTVMLVIGVIALIIGAYLAYNALQDSKTYNARKEEVEEELASMRASRSAKAQPKKNTQTASKNKPKADPAQKDEVAAIRAQLEKANAALGRSKSDLKQLRKDHKQLKKKNHDATQELSTLRSKDKAQRDIKRKASTQDSGAQAALVDLRLELADVREELETWKARAQAKPEPVVAELAPEPEPEPVVHTEIPDGADVEELKVKIKQIEAAYEKKLHHAKREADQAARELREKSKRTSLTAERERRRADNNDKAYTITQRELDASRARVRMLEEQLHKVQFVATTATNQLIAQQDTAPQEPSSMEEDSVVVEVDAQTDELPDGQLDHEDTSEQAPAQEPVNEDVVVEADAQTEDSDVSDEDQTQTPEADATTGGEPQEEDAQETAPQEDETQIDSGLKIKHTNGLAEVSAVDDAWSDFDVEE